MNIYTIGKKYSPMLIMATLIIFLLVDYSNSTYIPSRLNKSEVHMLYIDDFNDMTAWIKKNTGQDDVFLTEWELGTIVTGYTGRKAIATSKVYPSEALVVSERYKDLSRFFFSQNEEDAKKLMEKYNVSYILVQRGMGLGTCHYIDSCNRENFFSIKAFSGRPKVREKTIIGKLLTSQKLDYFRLMLYSKNFKIYKVLSENFKYSHSQPFMLDSGYYEANGYLNQSLRKDSSNLYGVIGGVVPHGIPYSLSQIADFFYSLGDNYTSIIIIGPDHEYVANDFVVTSSKNWTTPFGQLTADLEMINGLEIREDDFAQMNDWSIRVLLPFVKYKFPEAKIVPVLVRGDINKTEYDDLGNNIGKFSNPETLVLMSLDFSHIDNATNTELNSKEDIESVKILKSLDIGKVGEMEIESKNAVYVFLSAMKARNARNFILLNLSNSIYEGNGRAVGFISAVYTR